MFWKKVKRTKTPFIDKGGYYETVEGVVIDWTSRDAVEAQRWLAKNVLKTNKVGLIDPSQKLPGKNEISGSYYIGELSKSLVDHDDSYSLQIKVKGTNNESKWISISKDQLKRLMRIYKSTPS